LGGPTATTKPFWALQFYTPLPGAEGRGGPKQSQKPILAYFGAFNLGLAGKPNRECRFNLGGGGGLWAIFS